MKELYMELVPIGTEAAILRIYGKEGEITLKGAYKGGDEETLWMEDAQAIYHAVTNYQRLIEALKGIKHSMEQAQVHGNDYWREIRLSHGIATQALENLSDHKKDL